MSKIQVSARVKIRHVKRNAYSNVKGKGSFDGVFITIGR